MPNVLRPFAALLLALVAALPAAAEVMTEELTWTNPKDGTVVPGSLFYDPALARPDGTHPAVLFIHARRGLQPADRKYVAEIAAQGFLVLAPDWQGGRFIEPWPLEHDYATELDVALGLDVLKTHKRARADEKRALYGYSRGGYYATRIAAGAVDARYKAEVGCIVTIAGHFQDPNKSEPYQVYRYMPEVDQLDVPVLLVIGGDDTEVRVTNNARAYYALADAGKPAELLVLPMARRAFDFREYVDGSTQTPEEKIAKKITRRRSGDFMKRCLGG